jgi:hypothetical protein
MAAKRHVKVRLRRKLGDEIPMDRLDGKPLGSRYPDKNIIEDYLVNDPLDSKAKIDPFDTKDIPF